MDLVNILNSAIARLPQGDHSTGLNAIMKHISVAMRHFDRREDLDSFTDCIYRANQAYEGSLKEAYRVLADKDPSGKTTNDIEKYLEKKSIIRPRVLTQLTRYRQDYRNPSTHDHKLDFDEDEALLAIVAVCAFAKLLIDQISERLAFNAAADLVPSEVAAFADVEQFVDFIALQSLVYTDSQGMDLTDSEFEGGLAGSLSAFGFEVNLESPINVFDDESFTWDIFIRHGDNSVAIEKRKVREEFDPSEAHGIHFLARRVIGGGLSAGILITTSSADNKYGLYRINIDGPALYVVTKYDISEVRQMYRGSGDVRKIS